MMIFKLVNSQEAQWINICKLEIGYKRKIEIFLLSIKKKETFHKIFCMLRMIHGDLKMST